MHPYTKGFEFFGGRLESPTLTTYDYVLAIFKIVYLSQLGSTIFARVPEFESGTFVLETKMIAIFTILVFCDNGRSRTDYTPLQGDALPTELRYLLCGELQLRYGSSGVSSQCFCQVSLFTFLFDRTASIRLPFSSQLNALPIELLSTY